MSPNLRLIGGIGLFVLGLLMPAGALFVAGTAWPAGVQALVAGVLVCGPVILAILAVALLGTENFDRIANGVKAALKKKPAGNAGRAR
jgi:hypothetical protein